MLIIIKLKVKTKINDKEVKGRFYCYDRSNFKEGIYILTLNESLFKV
jgi:hypothetical protein